MPSIFILLAVLVTSQMTFGYRFVRSPTVRDVAGVSGNLATGPFGGAQAGFSAGAAVAGSAAHGFQAGPSLAAGFLGQNRAVRSPQLQDFANVFGNLATGAVASGQAALAGGTAAAGSAVQGFQNLAGSFFSLGQNRHTGINGGVNQPVASNPPALGNSHAPVA